MNKWLDEQKIGLMIFGYRIKDIPWIYGFITYFVILVLGVLCKLTDGFDTTCTVSSDDWFRSETIWNGLDNVAPDPTAMARKRVDAGDMRPHCPECGGTDIVRGEHIETR